MRKIKIGGLLAFVMVVLVAVVVAINVMLTLNVLKGSELTLAGIEALAKNEGGGDEGEPTCAAGGCHSISCSFEGEISVLGNSVHVSCSTSCEDAWACCHLTAYCFPKSRCTWF